MVISNKQEVFYMMTQLIPTFCVAIEVEGLEGLRLFCHNWARVL